MLRTSRPHLLAVAFLPILFAPNQAAGQGSPPAPPAECRWEVGNRISGLDADVLDLAVLSHGDEHEIYAAGRFRFADGRLANGVAQWNGRSWQPLEGPDGVGVDREVWALEVFDYGGGPALYAAGWFETAGGIATHNIARWTGTQWAPVGEPPGTEGAFAWIHTLEVLDAGSGPALYAGGFFTSIGGVEANGVARWDGSRWSPVGSGPGEVQALTMRQLDDGRRLVAALRGAVLEFDGTEWIPLGDENRFLRHSIHALATWNGGAGTTVYAAGRDSQGLRAVVSRWTGTEWVDLPTLGATLEFAEIYALEPAEIDGVSVLVAAGVFPSYEGESIRSIAAWDGVAWRPFVGSGKPGVNQAVHALQWVDDGPESFLLVGGTFTEAGDTPASRVARWQGSAWSALESPVVPGNGLNDAVFDYVTWNDGRGDALYAAGAFELAGGTRVNNVARWNGRGWEALEGPSGIGTDGYIEALAVFDDGSGSALYAAGFFDTAGGVAARNIARWNGSSWSALESGGGNGLSSAVTSLTVWDDGEGPALYAGGFFERAGGVESRRIARWDGERWSGLDEPNGPRYGVVLDLHSFDDGTGDALYVVGSIGRSGQDGGPELDRTAKWDGASWSTLYRNFALSRWVETLEVWDDGNGADLYAAGDGGHLARLDGNVWVRASETEFPWFRSLRAWDDGTGSKLYAAGSGFRALPGIEDDNFLVRWDGTEWSPFDGQGGTQPDDAVVALYPWNQDGASSLLLGGFFTAVDSVASAYAARWTCGSASRCASDPEHSLCLGAQDRFVVNITWRDFEGNEGSGRVVPFQTDDSGLFYFFGEDNWELLVKVLDGCGVNGSYWVFSAATTNVEYTLTVTDTGTGDTRSYFNPLGTAAPAVTDTAAFPSCSVDSGGSSSAEPVVSPEEAGLRKISSTSAPYLGVGEATAKDVAEEVAGDGAKADCTPSATTMCLAGGRFAVEIDWRDFEGNTGPGQVVPDVPADGSGLFQFFGEKNWEVLVKVLDACDLSDRFWVFAAATTSVEYTLRVTDTVTGELVRYRNPLGNAASAITDTDAFATCD